MKRFLITAHIVFVLVGIATTMLGPILPLLARRWQLSDGQSAFFFVAQFLGGFLGSIGSTELVRRFSLHFTIRLGLLVTAAGIALVTTPLLPMAICGIALYGIGIGFCSPTITAAVGDAVPERRAAFLNLLNFVWTVGAISAPALLTAALQHSRLGVSGALAVFAAILVPTDFVFPRISVTAPQKITQPLPLTPMALRLIITTGVLIFIYVGIENGVAGWLPTFSSRAHNFDARHSAALQATFWTALLAGRFGAPGILTFLNESRLLMMAIVAALLGTVGVLVANTGASLFISVFVLGLGLAPIFPTAIAILSDALGGQSGSRLGWMFAAAGLGGALLPYCIGTVSSLTSSLRAGLALLVFAEAALLLSHFFMSGIAAKLAPKKTAIYVGEL